MADHHPGLPGVPPGLLPLVRCWKVFILTRARNSLTRHEPLHRDLPQIVVDLQRWKEMGRG